MRILEVPSPGCTVVPEERIHLNAVQPGAVEIMVSLFVQGFREYNHDCDVYVVSHSPYTQFRNVRNLYPLRTNFIEWDQFNNLLIDTVLDHPEIDIIHLHATGCAQSSRWIEVKKPVIMTWHDPPLLFDEKESILNISKVMRHKKVTPVSISHFQKQVGSTINSGIAKIPTIYNGINIHQYSHTKARSNRYFSMGRVVPEKGFDIAVNTCIKAGVQLDIAGFIHSPEFFEEKVKPKIDNDNIKYHGVVYGNIKRNLYQTCKAFLNPIRWSEPFGLTLVEALAAGASIIGFARGAVSEVVGNCGVFVQSEKHLVEALQQGMPKISPTKCRDRAEKFSYEKMCKEYLNLFGGLM
jgi:glycosyltransferase involved in cell wall biosynthesis